MFVPKLGRVTSTKPRTPTAQQTGVWLKLISDQALVNDPVAVAQCVLPSCTDNIGLKPDAVKGVDRVCLQRVTVTFIGSATTIISTTRSSEGSKDMRNIVYQTLAQVCYTIARPEREAWCHV